MSDRTKKTVPAARPKNTISRRDWVARAIEVARKAVGEEAPPARPKASKPLQD